MLRRYAVEIGLTKNVHPHLFRHSTLSLLDVKGLSEAEQKALSGHTKDSKALMTYHNPIGDNAVEKSIQALNLNQQSKTNPEPIQKPIQQPKQQDKETRLFTAYKQGVITKEEYLRLMQEEPDNNPVGYL